MHQSDRKIVQVSLQASMRMLTSLEEGGLIPPRKNVRSGEWRIIRSAAHKLVQQTTKQPTGEIWSREVLTITAGRYQ